MTHNHAEAGQAPCTSALQQAYLGDLLAGRWKAAAEKVMTAFDQGCSIAEIYVDVFQESLYAIGALWESNRISVEQEHMGTAITQYVMSKLYEHMEVSERRRGRVVMTGVQGELHQVGAHMVADVLESDGWDVLFLGANVSPELVILGVRRHKAHILGISASLVANISKVCRLVAMVRGEFGDEAPAMLLGGRAFDAMQQLPTELEGCRLARDLHDAVELARTIDKERN